MFWERQRDEKIKRRRREGRGKNKLQCPNLTLSWHVRLPPSFHLPLCSPAPTVYSAFPSTPCSTSASDAGTHPPPQIKWSLTVILLLFSAHPPFFFLLRFPSQVPLWDFFFFFFIVCLCPWRWNINVLRSALYINRWCRAATDSQFPWQPPPSSLHPSVPSSSSCPSLFPSTTLWLSRMEGRDGGYNNNNTSPHADQCDLREGSHEVVG